MVYCLALPPKLTGLHNVFDVSMLKRYYHDPSHIIPHQEAQGQADLTYEELSIKILDWMEKVLHNKRILIVKVQWQHQTSKEATWELEAKM